MTLADLYNAMEKAVDTGNVALNADVYARNFRSEEVSEITALIVEVDGTITLLVD